MKKISIAILIALFLGIASDIEAGFFTWRYREHATDCTSLTDGKSTDACYEIDDETLYKCQPTSGDCDTPGEWVLISGGSLDALSDVTITTPSTNQTILYNGSQWVNAAPGTSFTFSIASFTQSGGGSTTQEIGTGTWLTSGAITFSATYNNGPATDGYVSHSGWSNLTLGGVGFVGPTASVASVSYPASAGGTKVFTLNATNGTTSPTSSITFTFINRRFWGVSTTTSGYTEADIEGLANNELSNSKSQTKTITAGSGEYLIFSWPTRLGTGTFTVNGFSGGFQSPETVSVTNASGFTENYYVYRSTNSNLGSVTVVVT